MRVLGMISGTSHDGIDTCLVELEMAGEVLHATVLNSGTEEYSSELRQLILASLPPSETTFEDVCKLDTKIGQEFAGAAQAILDQHGSTELVASHGQTMFHWVEGDLTKGTLQLGDPAWISQAVQAPVISNLRIQDIVSGGQGAPLVPILDLLTLGSLPGVTASLNLGGIANVTIIQDGEVVAAFDTGPASALIDAVVVKYQLNPKGYDENGLIASLGTVNHSLLDKLLDQPYYRQAPPKSTGKEFFHVKYLDQILTEMGIEISPEDLVATVTELSAITVADALKSFQPKSLFVAGGGFRNQTLMESIESQTSLRAKSFAETGIEPDIKEAFAMALIGYLAVHNLPATFTATTGASSPPVLGRLTPGPDGYAVPEPLTSTPVRLLVQHA